MAHSYPYTLSEFADLLRVKSVVWSIRRSDELSGTGDGRVWQAELAPPLWTGDVVLANQYHTEAKKVSSMIRALHGSANAFMLYDPFSKFPAYDPDGSIFGASEVTVLSVGGDRTTLSLAGFPAGYKLTFGEKLQITYTQGSTTRYAFLEISNDRTAAIGGSMASIEVFPNVPTGVMAGDAVIVIKPACKVVIVPGSHIPGTMSGRITEGQSFQVIQKK